MARVCVPLLTDEEVLAIRHAAQTTNFGDLAQEYGVSAATISAAVRGYTYRHVGGPITRDGRKRAARRRLKEGRNTPMAIFTPSDVRRMRQMAADGVPTKELVRIFGAARSTINHILAGTSYKHVR